MYLVLDVYPEVKYLDNYKVLQSIGFWNSIDFEWFSVLESNGIHPHTPSKYIKNM